MSDAPSYTFTVFERSGSRFWWVKIYVAGEGGEPRRESTRIPIEPNRRESERAAQRAAEAIAARLAEAVAIAAPAGGMTSLKEVADRMIQAKEADRRRARTLATHAWNLDKYVLPFLGAARDVRSIRRADLEALKASLSHLEPQSVNNVLTAIRQVLKHAHHVEELIEAVPSVANVQTSPEGKGVALTPEQFGKLIDNVDPRAVEARQWLIFLVNTGLRKFEALAMRWRWVDFEARTLTIPAEYRKGGKHGALLPLNAEALAILEERRSHGTKRGSHGVVLPLPTGPDDRVWLQVKHDGARNTAAKRAGLDVLSPLGKIRNHDLRHTMGSRAFANGASLPEVRDLLGHRTLTMVSRYAHSQPERLRAAVDGLGMGQAVRKKRRPGTAHQAQKPKQRTKSRR